MQIREPLGSIRPDHLATDHLATDDLVPDDLAGAQLSAPSAEMWDLSNANHDAAALLLQSPARDRMRTAGVAAAALAVTFALGWVGGLAWQEFADSSASNQVAQKETLAPRIAGMRPSGRGDGPRRTAASDPAVTGSIPRPSATPPRLPALAVAPASMNAPSVALAMRQPLAAAPETRPGTIPGWSVVEVRDGTAVLDGPDGVRMAARGDVIAGIGRVESIVRWGDRWIVATANGLIATR